MNATKNPNAEFGYGAGHVDPVKAGDPGLVYEAFKEDYLKMFCSLGYDDSKLSKIIGDNSSCPKGPNGSPKELNYPIMTVQVQPTKPCIAKFPRMVTHVSLKSSTYKAEISAEGSVKISVAPRIPSFGSFGEQKSFIVTVSGGGLHERNKFVSASLVWSDGTHRVRSPIVAYT